MWSLNLFAFFAVVYSIQLFDSTDSAKTYPDVLSLKTTINDIKGSTSTLQQLINNYFRVSIFKPKFRT